MNKLALLLCVPLAFALGACGDDNGGDRDASVDASQPDASGDAGTPAVPALGPQVDRMGRPAITTALVSTFLTTDLNVDAATRNAEKDAYNADDAPSRWVDTYSTNIAIQLGIVDSIDQVCGNQLAYDTEGLGYGFLAGALAADYLWIDSTRTSCDAYLAVEANALDIVPNTECGGRAPTVDVIDTSYSVLVSGTLSGLGDGIEVDDAVQVDDVFPFLAAPL